MSDVVTVTGQVFIATKAGVGAKLALVTVTAYPQREFDNQLTEIAHLERDLKNQLAGQISKMDTDLKDALLTAKEAREKFQLEDSALAKTTNENHWDVLPRQQKAKRELSAAEDVLKEIADKLAILKQRRNVFLDPVYYIRRLKSPHALTKTDADGNFDFNFSPDQYVLVAEGKRLLGDSTESYVWIVSVNANKPSQKVLLSNDNTSVSNCAECIRLPGFP